MDTTLLGTVADCCTVVLFTYHRPFAFVVYTNMYLETMDCNAVAMHARVPVHVCGVSGRTIICKS